MLCWGSVSIKGTEFLTFMALFPGLHSSPSVKPRKRNNCPTKVQGIFTGQIPNSNSTEDARRIWISNRRNRNREFSTELSAEYCTEILIAVSTRPSRGHTHLRAKQLVLAVGTLAGGQFVSLNQLYIHSDTYICVSETKEFWNWFVYKKNLLFRLCVCPFLFSSCWFV